MAIAARKQVVHQLVTTFTRHRAHEPEGEPPPQACILIPACVPRGPNEVDLLESWNVRGSKFRGAFPVAADHDVTQSRLGRCGRTGQGQGQNVADQAIRSFCSSEAAPWQVPPLRAPSYAQVKSEPRWRSSPSSNPRPSSAGSAPASGSSGPGRAGGTGPAARRSLRRSARSSAAWLRPTPCGERRGFTANS